MTDCYTEIMRRVLTAEPLGSRELPSGVRLIGHVPHVGPEAYLHVVFPCLDDSQIATIQERIQRPLSDELQAFYREGNGIDLFSDALSVHGLRTSYCRAGDEAWQPYCVALPNVEERPRGADETWVFFGSYGWDGSLLAMCPGSPVVHRCARDNAAILNEWPSLATMLLCEVDRLECLFDENGRQIDEDLPTTPD